MPDDPTWLEHVASSKRRWHARQRQAPLREKVRILLQLQREDLPLIARQRPLRPWERPWDVEP